MLLSRLRKDAFPLKCRQFQYQVSEESNRPKTALSEGNSSSGTARRRSTTTQRPDSSHSSQSSTTTTDTIHRPGTALSSKSTDSTLDSNEKMIRIPIQELMESYEQGSSRKRNSFASPAASTTRPPSVSSSLSRKSLRVSQAFSNMAQKNNSSRMSSVRQSISSSLTGELASVSEPAQCYLISLHRFKEIVLQQLQQNGQSENSEPSLSSQLQAARQLSVDEDALDQATEDEDSSPEQDADSQDLNMETSVELFNDRGVILGPNSIIPKYSLVQCEVRKHLKPQMQQIRVLISILREELYDEVLSLMSEMEWSIDEVLQDLAAEGSLEGATSTTTLDNLVDVLHNQQNSSTADVYPLIEVLTWISQIKMYIFWKLGRFNDMMGILNGDEDFSLITPPPDNSSDGDSTTAAHSNSRLDPELTSLSSLSGTTTTTGDATTLTKGIRLLSFLPNDSKKFYEAILCIHYFKWEDARIKLKSLCARYKEELSHSTQNIMDLSQHQQQDYIQISTDEHDDLLIMKRVWKVDVFLTMGQLNLHLNDFKNAKEYLDLSLKQFTSLSFYNGMLEARCSTLLYFHRLKQKDSGEYFSGAVGDDSEPCCTSLVSTNGAAQALSRQKSQIQRQDESASGAPSVASSSVFSSSSISGSAEVGSTSKEGTHLDDSLLEQHSFDQRIDHQIREINSLLKTDMVGKREQDLYWFTRGTIESNPSKQREHFKTSLNLQKELEQQDLVADTMFHIALSFHSEGDSERCSSILLQLSQSGNISIYLRVRLSIMMARIDPTGSHVIQELHRALKLLHFSLQQENLPLSTVVSLKTHGMFVEIFTLLRQLYIRKEDTLKSLFYNDILKVLQHPRTQETLYSTGKCSVIENHETDCEGEHLVQSTNALSVEYTFFHNDLYIWILNASQESSAPLFCCKQQVVPRIISLMAQINRNTARLAQQEANSITEDVLASASIETELMELHDIFFGGSAASHFGVKTASSVDTEGHSASSQNGSTTESATARPLVVIPDHSSLFLCFELFLNEHTKRYLCEDFMVTILPSIHELRRKTREARPMPRQDSAERVSSADSITSRESLLSNTSQQGGLIQKPSSRSSSRGSSRSSSRGGAKENARNAGFVLIATELHQHHNEVIQIVDQEAPELAPRSQSIKKLRSFLCKYQTQNLYIAADCKWEENTSASRRTVLKVSRGASKHYEAIEFKVPPDEVHTERHSLLVIPFSLNALPVMQLAERCHQLLWSSFSLACCREIREFIVKRFVHYYFGEGESVRGEGCVAFQKALAEALEEFSQYREAALLFAGLHITGVDRRTRDE